MSELKKVTMISLTARIDKKHGLHALIQDGVLKSVSVSDADDPTEDLVLKDLQPLADAIDRLHA